MSGIQTTAAELPKPPTGGGFTGQATFNDGPNFKGTVKDGEVLATFKEAKATSSNKFPNADGTPKQQILWLFTVDGQEGEGELGRHTSYSTHEKSNLPGVLAAIGHPIPTPAAPTIDPTPYIGAKVRLYVKNEPSSKDPSKKFPRVKDVLAR